MSDEIHLRSRVDAFVNQLSALIQRQALEAVAEALKKSNGSLAAAAAAKQVQKAVAKLPAVAAKAPLTASRAPASPRATKLPVAAARKPGEKRPPEELAKITQQVESYIKANPNQGVEQIAKALRTPTKDLTLPIHKLLGDRRIGAKGQKRATRYFPM